MEQFVRQRTGTKMLSLPSTRTSLSGVKQVHYIHVLCSSSSLHGPISLTMSFIILFSALEDAVNDWVSWTNVSNRTTNKFLIVHWLTNLTQDVFSYAKEQTVDGTHNLVVVLMREHNIELQSAMDLAGQRCIDCITKFEEIRQILPTCGAEVDQQVARYVQGLQNWIVGSL